jgi:hypothetical protein
VTPEIRLGTGVGIAANPAGAMPFKRRGTQKGLAVGWRNSLRCKVRLARIVIKRSAADRFGVFGAAGALKKSRAVMTAVTRCVRRRSDSITERGSSNRRDHHLILLKSPLRACAATIPMHRASLRICNAKATLRMRLCTPRRSHLNRAKFIPQLSVNRRKIVLQNPAMMPILF